MKIDTNKLKDYLNKHGISYVELSRAMGYNDSYISNLINKNKGISSASYNLLCLTAGVDKTEFLSKEAQLDRIERKLDKLLEVLCK